VTTWVSRNQKGKTNLDFTEARDSEWQWYPLGYMQVCTLLQTDNHASTPPLSVLQAGCSSCHPTNSVKVLKAYTNRVKIPKRTQSTDANEEISPTAVSPILEPVPDPRMDTMPVISALQ